MPDDDGKVDAGDLTMSPSTEAGAPPANCSTPPKAHGVLRNKVKDIAFEGEIADVKFTHKLDIDAAD